MTGGFIRAGRFGSDSWRIFTALALVTALAACGSSSRHAVPQPQPTRLTVPAVTTTTTPGAQTSGPRTVLSPIGLRVRAQPSRTAPVLGTGAQGTVLNVLGHTDQDGGWFQVKGESVTGWISDDPALSAPGQFADYNTNGEFAALYPVGWSVAASPSATVDFHSPSGAETIVVTPGATVNQLGLGRPGYTKIASQPVIVCGVTSSLVTYHQVAVSTTGPPAGTAPGPYLMEVHLRLDAQHALGIDATLTDLSQQQTVRDFVNSVTFPSPQCQH